jgi:hypothetical protein
MCIACAGFARTATLTRVVRAVPVGSWYADQGQLKIALPRAARFLLSVSGSRRHKRAPSTQHEHESLPGNRRRQANARRCLGHR